MTQPYDYFDLTKPPSEFFEISSGAHVPLWLTLSFHSQWINLKG